MDAPPVQYVTTSDGFSIACSLTGEGNPLVLTPTGFNHIHLLWSSPLFNRTYEHLASAFRLVQYDGRGQGLSRRGVPESTRFHDFVLDLETVIDGLNLDQVVLLGTLQFGKVAFEYSLSHPERVRALVLWNTNPGSANTGAWGSGASLVRNNWDYLVEVSARTGFPEDDTELLIKIFRESNTPGDFSTLNRERSAHDITSKLSRLSVPTMVMSTRASAWSFAAEEGSKQLAASIPGARLSIFDDVGGGLYTLSDKPPPAVMAMREFVSTLPAPVDARDATATLLSSRELEVLRLIAAGKSNQQIADELVISLNTVQRHVSNILTKTGLTNRVEAAVYAHEHSLA